MLSLHAQIELVSDKGVAWSRALTLLESAKRNSQSSSKRKHSQTGTKDDSTASFGCHDGFYCWRPLDDECVEYVLLLERRHG